MKILLRLINVAGVYIYIFLSPYIFRWWQLTKIMGKNTPAIDICPSGKVKGEKYKALPYVVVVYQENGKG